ncbi:TPA: LysR family transcriptional regulator [Pseudomonas putida]|nr:LysR family transcriptional regulator [Pseudomonas putida]
MITIKQIEAVYWISRLGSFEAAAEHLNTSQSAISKRIQDLEFLYDKPLFDRSKRTAQLTQLGHEVASLARSLLSQRDAILQRLESPEKLRRKLRLGVTELTALTWLPDLVQGIKQRYPNVEIIPEVGLSPVLFERLDSNSIDLVIVPDVFSDNRYSSTRLKSVVNAWMCTPSIAGEPGPLTLDELSGRMLLVQGVLSGMGKAYSEWFKAEGVDVTRYITCNNLLAQIGMAVSGLATAYLPLHCLDHLLERKQLQVLDVTPALPQLYYKAIHRAPAEDLFMAQIVEIAEQTCDFTKFIIH